MRTAGNSGTGRELFPAVLGGKAGSDRELWQPPFYTEGVPSSRFPCGTILFWVMTQAKRT